MSAVYTVNSLSDVKYGVVQIGNSPPGLTLPAPSKVPEVARDKVEAHIAREADGYAIVVWHESEPDPTDGAAEALDHRKAREHVRQSADVWEADST